MASERLPGGGIEDLYATLLENLRGFDLDELEDMGKHELLAHFEAASRAWKGLDEKLGAGGELPLDWQPVEDEPGEAKPAREPAQATA